MTIDPTTAITNLLLTETAKLFPAATSITVRFDDADEATYVNIDGVDYGFFAGSDDDCFAFVKGATDWETHMNAEPDFTIDLPEDLFGDDC